MIRFEGKKTPVQHAAILVSLAAVFALDTMTPLGVAEWILYLVPMALSLFLWRPQTPLLIAFACTVLILLGFAFSPPPYQGLPPWVPEINRAMAVVTIWIFAAMARQFIQTKVRLEEQHWIREGQTELGVRIQGEQPLSELADGILGFLCEYLEAPVAALYGPAADGRLHRLAAYACSQNVSARETMEPNEGLIGQAYRNRRLLEIDDLPSGYLPITSALGKATPRHLVIVPTHVDGSVTGVVELGFLHPVGKSDRDLLESTAEQIAVALRSAEYRIRQLELLQQTQRQAAELEAQQETLQVINEELESQSHALKESQARLEADQAELEQLNLQLGEQAQILEQQRDDLSRSQVELLDKAEALERASRYKSEFLANMSHELRTPLNSALILAKLLSENQAGNLTDEQVTCAATIYASGRDLLDLVNDLLDLSRIEAGRLDIHPEEVRIAAVVGALEKTFQPLAAKKGLFLRTVVEADFPQSLRTDPLRLQQILRNLLSNAVKFTARGGITLTMSRSGTEHLAFAVQDTGVGIPADQHGVIFEAFRQADGSTQRRFEGTGLGLTISRELALRMGGSLALESVVGEGSTFTLIVPHSIEEAVTPSSTRSPLSSQVLPRQGPAGMQETPLARPARTSPERPRACVPDDREGLERGERTILVIEDDARFAAILRDQARELRFRSLVATTASEARDLAQRFLPSGILMDLHLPDQSGLMLLDQLKRNPATRHIPVHVISVADHSQQALQMGAVGYVLKPVTREQITQAIARLEAEFEHAVRRVLVVEDAQARRESIEALLRHEGLEIISVGQGQRALNLLREGTFDCMVLDLVLPDMSGYDLLEKMAGGEFSVPPVIVYTGRTLTADEEMRLHRFASSVIIKGARSPERLLDEVSLFLHQVEAHLPPEQQRMLRLVRERESALDGRAILVVEDDARNIFALSSVLEPKGAKVRIARNGREALEVLDAASRDGTMAIDLVLMDVMMPVMDGLTAMREIRRRPEWRKLPIIALTAKAMSDDRHRCIEAGANDYVSKPLDVDKLVSLVKVWLPKPRLCAS